MKKDLLVLGLGVAMLSPVAAFASAYSYLDAPNAGNRNFSGLMQQQFEKKETLDFINNPEEYKIKREQKDAYLDYKEGKTDAPDFLKPQINVDNTRPATNKMQFTKDENGQIRIQGIN